MSIFVPPNALSNLWIGKNVRDPELADLGEPGVDLGGDAVRHAERLAAVEQMGDLDPLDDRELAVVDHLAGLERVGDDPEEALARAAGLGVDVVLERAQVRAWSSTASMSLHGLRRVVISVHSASLSTSCVTITRSPAIQARLMPV